MRHVAFTFICSVVLLGGVGLSSVRAGDPSPLLSPSPTASPSPTPTVTPAPPEIVKLALGQERRAKRAWHRWDRAKRCFLQRAGIRVGKRPPHSAGAAVWLDRMVTWQRQAADFRTRFGKLRHMMRHPGGPSNGVRWLPLARFVGWPEYALSQLASIIMRESSGRERAANSTAHRGLLQFAWQWYRGVWLIHGHGRVFNPYDPEATLDAGLDVWEDQGHSFLPAWAQTAW